MFEITRNQLLGLNDVQLRELVARLCQAELEINGLPASAVRWSGAHTAADGGLDVECRLDDCEFSGGYVPRLPTGFQVKKPKMPPSKIEKEMRPEGNLRPVFSELAASNGSYVIVSLDDDPTGRPKTQRKTAIREQLCELPDCSELHTDFYGRAELVDWLRQHPSVQIWVRDALGMPLDGWKPLGRWTNVPPDDNDELICKPGLLIASPDKDASGLDIGQGIQCIRNLVRTSNKALRIVGLSGVGKTRIVQALFEDSVGTDPLDRSLAIYADLGTNPQPTPSQVVAHLKAANRPAVLVLDNCPAATHNLLAGEASDAPEIRLITIEYDIREDKPELTTVIRVDAEGCQIAEALVSRRYPALDERNARTIAEFSGGNARVALALANAVEDNENLSELSNAQLFDRLFHQRGGTDENLLAAAQTLALVYSYSVARNENGVDELGTLSGLIGQNRQALYAATRTLLDRQLAQQRGNWRAILPPAIANRLAARGLNYIPIEDLRDTFETLPNDRLLISFGKRLGYLHVNDTARQVVQSWLSPGGLLNPVENLSEDRIQLLMNVAPAAPEAVLDTIETRVIQLGAEAFFARVSPRSQKIAELLGAIAYDAALFERCIALLVALAAAQQRDRQPQPHLMDRLCSLFSLFLSGTEASPDTRERILRHYIRSAREDERRIASLMLQVALKGDHWFSFATLDFGARPRSFGYQPVSQDECDQWFRRFISLAIVAAVGEDPELSAHIRETLANELDTLIFECPELRPDLMDAARSLHNHRPWLEGWRAVRSIKHLDHPEAHGEDSHKAIEFLDELDDLLRPTALTERIRAHVCDAGHRQFSVRDEFDTSDQRSWENSHNQAADHAYELGVAAGNEPKVLDEILQDLFGSETGFLVDFGKGLVSQHEAPRLLWNGLVEYLETAAERPAQCDMLCGVLALLHEHDQALAKRILSDSVENPALRPFITKLHSSVPASDQTIRNLSRALEFDDTPIDQFTSLAWAPSSQVLPESLLCKLFTDILGKQKGSVVVITGLNLRTKALKDGQLGFGCELRCLGLAASIALLRDPLCGNDSSIDRHLPDVLGFCLDGLECTREAIELVDAFLARVQSNYALMAGLRRTAAILAEKMPFRFLDAVFFASHLSDPHLRRLFRERRRSSSPLAGVHKKTLIEWCRQGDFQQRLSMLSKAIHPFADENGDNTVAFSGQARAILNATSAPSVILDNFANSIRPQGWSGSLANIIAGRCRAFESLLQNDRPDVRDAAQAVIPRIKQWEHEKRQRERDESRVDQRFE